MYRSNTVIGFLNLITLISSVTMVGGGLLISKNSTSCSHLLKTPLLILGFLLLIVSIAGLIGACFNVSWVLWVYLFVMFFMIAALMGLTVFGFAVTSHGGGVDVAGRVYREYRFEDYGNWLRNRVGDLGNWETIKNCVLGTKVCEKIVTWTPLDYLQKNLSPVQSGCCKPPTSCVYNTATLVVQDADCSRWNNIPSVLCYDCDSCKAGVLETLRAEWRKLSVLNIILLVFLIAIYSLGCCAFQNAKRAETEAAYPYWQRGMSKIRPNLEDYWDRMWHGHGSRSRRRNSWFF